MAGGRRERWADYRAGPPTTSIGRSSTPIGLCSCGVWARGLHPNSERQFWCYPPRPTYRAMKEFEVRPIPDDPRLTVTVAGLDHEGRAIETAVVTERPLSLFLNAREIVTMMTIGDHPDLLAVGYLLNQNMLKPDDEITAIEYAEDIQTVIVRTKRQTDYEDKLKRKIQTSGCAQGTIFGDLMEEFDRITLNPYARIKTSWLYQLTKKINTEPSLYLKAGAIHGCVLCRKDKPLVYMEDVGRHN